MTTLVLEDETVGFYRGYWLLLQHQHPALLRVAPLPRRRCLRVARSSCNRTQPTLLWGPLRGGCDRKTSRLADSRLPQHQQRPRLSQRHTQRGALSAALPALTYPLSLRM